MVSRLRLIEVFRGGLGLRVWGFGFRVWGLGFRALGLTLITFLTTSVEFPPRKLKRRQHNREPSFVMNL